MTIWHGLRSALIGFSGDSGGYPQAGDLSPGADGCKTALSLWRGGFGMLGSTGGETFQVIAAKDNALGLGEKVQIVRCIISDWVTVTECRCETGGVCWRGGLVVSRGSGVYIRFFGNGGLWFRPYGGSLWKSPKVTKGLLPHHSAPRLGSVCPNAGLNPWAAVMGHPWPRTANPASCRVTHGFTPAFGQRGLTGRRRSKAARFASWLRGGAALFQCLDLCHNPAVINAVPRRVLSELTQNSQALTASKCGRGLAPDSGMSATTEVTDPPLSGASPLPHLQRAPAPTGGTRSLAKSGRLSGRLGFVFDPDLKRPVKWLRGASALFHGLDLCRSPAVTRWGRSQLTENSWAFTASKCGRGLAPDSGASGDVSFTDPPLSGASPLPHLQCAPAPTGGTRSLAKSGRLSGRLGFVFDPDLKRPVKWLRGASALFHDLDLCHSPAVTRWGRPQLTENSWALTASKCGRGLAPDSGASGDVSFTDPPLSGASPLPHLQRAPAPTGGTRSLAKSGRLSGRLGFVFDPDLKRPVKWLRGASALFHDLDLCHSPAVTRWGRPQLTENSWALTASKCGRGLAPDSGASGDVSFTDPPLSGASPLPHLQRALAPAMGQGRAGAAARGVMPGFGRAEPKRGAEWWGKSPFGYFLGSFPKVARCKSATHSRRYRSNGYVLNPKGSTP